MNQLINESMKSLRIIKNQRRIFKNLSFHNLAKANKVVAGCR